MTRIIIIGTPQGSIASVINDLGEIVEQVEEPKHIECGWDLAINPYQDQPSHIDLHPNDNWRGKGKRKKRFK